MPVPFTGDFSDLPPSLLPYNIIMHSFVGIDSTTTPAAMPKEEAKRTSGNPTTQSYQESPVSKLNNYYQKHSFEPPKYDDQRVGEHEFRCTVTFRGETFEGPIKSSTKDAKRAAAQMVIDSMNITD